MSERIYVKSTEIVEVEGLSKLYERLRLEAGVKKPFCTKISCLRGVQSYLWGGIFPEDYAYPIK